MAENPRAQEKIREAIELFKEKYYANSDINKIVNTRDATINEEGFLQLGSKFYIPKEWFTKENIVFDIAIDQFAENLVLSETKYLLSKIIDCEGTQKAVAEGEIRTCFLEQFRNFSDTAKVNTIFAPIDQYVTMHTDWLNIENTIEMNIRSGNLAILGNKPKILWSNKYIPFNDFIFINKSFGEWVSKPSFENRLTVSITESDKPDQMFLTFFVGFKFNITNPQKILIMSRTVH